MKKIYLPYILIWFVSLTNLFAQSPYTNVQIRSSSSYGEVSIEINPKNTNQLAGGCNINLTFYSNNGGLNWTNGTISNSQWGVWGDPVLVADTAGNFYYFHLSNTTQSPGYWIDRIVCQKSTNAGVTWNDPGSYTYFNPPTAQQDKQWPAVDFTHGPRGNWMYCTWTQFDDYGVSNPGDSSNILFARSTNAGTNWTGAVRINKLAGNCVDGDYTVEGAVPCVGPNGEVYVAWAGPLGLNNFKIFFDKSTDGGNTWLANDIIAASQPGGWDFDIAGINRSNGLPFTVCDYSNGPYRGNIYVNWTDSVSPGDHDIRVTKSTNGGLNWSAPIRVNDDPPGKEQFLTAMTVDQVTGYIYVVFYDRRNYNDNQTDVYLARSTNGGATFINERISSTPFIPSSFTFFGDYIDIAAHNGKIRPVWQRLQSGTLSVWTAIIDFPVAVENQNNKIPESYSLSQNFPNPFNPSTTIKFTVPKAGASNPVKLIVYDVLGKEIAVLVNETLGAGTYQFEWNASNQPSGIYFYKLITGDGSFSQTKKMVLVK
jgi:hypothetical protein